MLPLTLGNRKRQLPEMGPVPVVLMQGQAQHLPLKYCCVISFSALFSSCTSNYLGSKWGRRRFESTSRVSRPANVKLQSGEILTLNKSSTVQYTLFDFVTHLYKQSIRVVCKSKILDSSLRDRILSVGRNISGCAVYFWLGKGDFSEVGLGLDDFVRRTTPGTVTKLKRIFYLSFHLFLFLNS